MKIEANIRDNAEVAMAKEIYKATQTKGQALWVVDQIIKSGPTIPAFVPPGDSYWPDRLDEAEKFWKSVKDEIIKLP